MLLLLVEVLSFEEGFWEPNEQLCTVCVHRCVHCKPVCVY